jgi:hypothetical protein
MWMNNDDHSSDEEADDPLSGFGDSEEFLIYAVYSQLCQHKTHFSSMQNRYRALTSTWFLAAFAGIGFLISGRYNIELPFNVLIGILLLCFFSAFGITLLWFLDIVLYQRLWIGTVVELAKLEEKYSWLPKTNLNTLQIRTSERYRFLKSPFYIGINSVFLAVAAISLIYYFSANLMTVASIGFITALTFVVMKKTMIVYSGEKDVITTSSFQ